MSRFWKFASAFALFSLQACQGDYPLAPTLCDDWCHLTESKDACSFYSPSNCVRECEERGYTTRCSAEFEAALACVKGHPSRKQSCGVQGSNVAECTDLDSDLLNCAYSQPPHERY
jgi:hypothetical protein